MNGIKHILIVDDDAEFAGMVAQAIRDVSEEFTVRVSTDARSAIAEVQRAQAIARSYDLVITDIKMPGSSGLQLLETLAETAPETKTITMTAYHSPELAAQTQQLGVHAYLIKPIALSEFRRVVRTALSTRMPSAGKDAPGRATTVPPVKLSAAQRAAVERRLANLRATSNSMAALLVHVDGTLLAYDSLETDLDPGALCGALIDPLRTIAQAMEHVLNTASPIQQSYYGTETYGICTHRMDDAHVIITIFGPTVREGHVWYCMRQATDELALALLDDDRGNSARDTGADDDWRSKIERFFVNSPQDDKPKRRNIHSDRPSAARMQSRTEFPTAPILSPDASARSSRAQDATTAEQPSLAQTTMEAQNQERHSPQTQEQDTAPQVDWSSMDNIDWDASVDLDWDKFVEDTDQGFAGLDFDEAKKRGLIDNVESD